MGAQTYLYLLAPLSHEITSFTKTNIETNIETEN